MPKETSAGDYTEIEMGLKYAKTDTNRNEILLAVIDAMNDGKISQWESQHLIHFIFSMTVKACCSSRIFLRNLSFRNLTLKKVAC